MDADKLDATEEATLRFLRALHAVRDRADKDEYFARHIGIVGYRETGALRRASMDLTRALADLRRRP